MDLARFPRRDYTSGTVPTRIERLSRLTEYLGGPNIYMKREDLLMGLAGGGNKVRKLEFLVADALAKGADTLITAGAVQSNHCRLTLAAAAKEGLKCRLVLEEQVPGSYHSEASGNNFLFRLMGVEKIRVVAAGSDLNAEMELEAAEVAAAGGKAYIIPVGGSNPVGTTGYVACAQEILQQSFEMRLRVDHLVCASGSGGTHAGLLVGLYGNNARIPITGINVGRAKGPQEEAIHKLANETASYLGLRSEISRDEVTCVDQYVGPGYSLPTDEMVHAVRLLAEKEAILLDPVYTGKVMAGLLDLVETGAFKKGENVLFVHTGGSPALFAYIDDLLGDRAARGAR